MCAHLGLSDAETLLGTGLLRVGGRDLILHHDEASDPGVMHARLDLGQAAPERQEWLWHRLLVSNFSWGDGGVLGFGLTPEENRVVLTVQRAFSAETSGAEAADWLRRIVVCAEAYWSALAAGHSIADIRSLLPLRHAADASRANTPGPVNWDYLMDGFCSHAGLIERDQFLRDGTLEVAGINMLLRHDANIPSRFEVRIDLGRDPDLQRDKLWQGLLFNNFILGLNGRALFGLQPDHEHVVLALQQDLLSDTSPADIAELLAAMSANAGTFWERTRAEIHSAMRLGDASLRDAANPSGPLRNQTAPTP